jgi:hypothetical protein
MRATVVRQYDRHTPIWLPPPKAKRPASAGLFGSGEEEIRTPDGAINPILA